MSRTPQEIKASLEGNRQEFSVALDRLRGEVTALTDWRSQIQRHKPQVVAGAALAGLMVGRLLLRRRR